MYIFVPQKYFLVGRYLVTSHMSSYCLTPLIEELLQNFFIFLF